MRHKQKVQNILYQHYCEFIEFLNDLHVPSTLCYILIYLPCITILGDLLAHVNEIPIMGNLSQLSLSALILKMLEQLPWLLSLVKIMLLLILVLPLAVTIKIVVWSLLAVALDDIIIGYFWQKYMKSYICLAYGWYIRTFQRLAFPIMISIGIKLTVSKTSTNDPAVGLLIVIFALLNSLIFHYYDLQIPNSNKTQNQEENIFINFPNIIIENLLVLATIITINTTTGIIPFFCCLGLFVLRCITNHFLRFETDLYYLQSQFSLLCSIAIIISLCVGYMTKHYAIMMVCACVTICILLYNKPNNIAKGSQYAEIKETIEQIALEDIKKMLEEGKIAQTFRQAVLIERKKNSHRNQLIIDIIKNKCFEQQKLSGYSTKNADSLQLLNYEEKIVRIIKNILVIQEKSIEIFNLMKNKEPKQEILVKAVSKLVDLINENKEQFTKCMKINAMGIQLNSLVQLFFKKLYNDTIFIRESKSRLQEQSCLADYRTIHKQLFQKDKALIVIDVLDQIGKILKVSNNLPNVLGYTPHSLVGLSVNELIPYTARQCHDSILHNFIHNFTGEYFRKKPTLEFYAYNKSFHLQKIQIRSKFFFNFFHNFELAGVITKLKTQDYFIITDEMGNIEGWSAKVGQLFNFDDISGNECIAYNFMPLLPAAIKYDQNESYCMRTIFFKLSKMKTPKLMLFDKKKSVTSEQEMKRKQINAFYELMKAGQIMEGYVLNAQIKGLYIKQGDKSIKLIKLEQIRRIENMEKLENLLLVNQEDSSRENNRVSPDFNPTMAREKSLDQSSDTEFSIIKTSRTSDSPADFNFTLQTEKHNAIQDAYLKLSKDLDRIQGMFSSRNLSQYEFEKEKKEVVPNISENLNIQSAFDPKLERKNNFIWVVILITCVFIALLIQDSINTESVFQQLQSNKQQILRGNRAEMIYCKTAFNPNASYVSEFDNGNLLVFSEWLVNRNSTYSTFDNDTVEQNIFYLLNVQVPSTLHRILRLNNGTDQYMGELSRNFYNVIKLYQDVYTQFKQIWNVKIDEVKKKSNYQLIGYSFGIIIYELFLFFLYCKYKNQRKMAEAFFKFEKIDLDTKINSVKMIANVIQKRCQQWYIDLYLHQIKKISVAKKQQQQPQSMQLSGIQNHSVVKKEGPSYHSVTPQNDIMNQRKVQNQQFDELQVNLAKKRFYFFLILAAILLLTQVIYIILSGVLKSNMFNSFKLEVSAVDDASKLIVYPNLKMAALYYPVPPQILSKYEITVNKMLSQPNAYIPNLYKLLTQSPCTNCSFLSQILKTNYRSFYSYFIQTISNYNSSSSLSQMYYAVDVVVNNIQKNIHTVDTPSQSSASILYLISLLIFFVTVFLVLRNLESEYKKLECFLKFFNVEALLKNKHMSTVMAKNM